MWRQGPTWGPFAPQCCRSAKRKCCRETAAFHRLYQDPTVATFPTPLSSSPSPHYWYPQIKAACAEAERTYPEFYSFVGSHVAGRYSSLAKGWSDAHNSQEEDWVGWMNWIYISAGAGVYKNIDQERYSLWDEVGISKEGLQKARCNRPMFMNVNDKFSKDNRNYQKQLGWFKDAMDAMFPADLIAAPPMYCNQTSHATW